MSVHFTIAEDIIRLGILENSILSLGGLWGNASRAGWRREARSETIGHRVHQQQINLLTVGKKQTFELVWASCLFYIEIYFHEGQIIHSALSGYVLSRSFFIHICLTPCRPSLNVCFLVFLRL